MRTFDIARRAARSLRNAKARTVLTSLAIAVGAFTITVSLAAGEGARDPWTGPTGRRVNLEARARKAPDECRCDRYGGSVARATRVSWRSDRMEEAARQVLAPAGRRCGAWSEATRCHDIMLLG